MLTIGKKTIHLILLNTQILSGITEKSYNPANLSLNTLWV